MSESGLRKKRTNEIKKQRVPANIKFPHRTVWVKTMEKDLIAYQMNKDQGPDLPESTENQKCCQ